MPSFRLKLSTDSNKKETPQPTVALLQRSTLHEISQADLERDDPDREEVAAADGGGGGFERQSQM